tara:strand:+ start:614 stop:790 length:177 start_codon:yes stop_codon:yes gene_type:complete
MIFKSQPHSAGASKPSGHMLLARVSGSSFLLDEKVGDWDKKQWLCHGRVWQTTLQGVY